MNSWRQSPSQTLLIRRTFEDALLTIYVMCITDAADKFFVGLTSEFSVFCTDFDVSRSVVHKILPEYDTDQIHQYELV